MATGNGMTTLAVLPDQSAVLIEARSSVGLISFGTTTLAGEFRGVLSDGEFDLTETPHASLVLPVRSLTSGNSLYDAEIRGRLNAQRYPTIEANLRTAEALGSGRFSVIGDLTIHGTTRELTTSLTVTAPTGPTTPADVSAPPEAVTVVATGTVIVDIRDFDIELPRGLMLQIFPDVTVSFRVTAA
jgi:polyisoprenoid-binding protein YceI